jgi:hypothetical protein
MRPIAPSRTIETSRERRIDVPQTALAMRTFFDNARAVCGRAEDSSTFRIEAAVGQARSAALD